MKTIQVRLGTGLSMPPLGFKRNGEDWVLEMGANMLGVGDRPPVFYSYFVCVHPSGQNKGVSRLSHGEFRSEAEARVAWQKGFTVTEPTEGSNAAPWVRFLLDHGILERAE